MTLHTVPAYGRDYASAKAVLEAWNTNKDFMIRDISSRDDGSYVNKQDVPRGTSVQIRYSNLRKAVVIRND